MSTRYRIDTISFALALLDTEPRDPTPDIAYESATLGGVVLIDFTLGELSDPDDLAWWTRELTRVCEVLNRAEDARPAMGGPLNPYGEL